MPLPIPGASKNSWGSQLNEFLREAHNEDGSLKDVATETDFIALSDTVDGKLDSDPSSVESAVAAYGGPTGPEWSAAQGAIARVAPESAGSDGQVLTVIGGVPVWGNPAMVGAMTPVLAHPPVVTIYSWGSSPLDGESLVGFADPAYRYTGIRTATDVINYPQFTSPAHIYAYDGSKTIYAPGPYGVEFAYDGAEIELMVRMLSTGRMRVGVVGEGVNARTGTASPAADGNWYRIHVDFGTARHRQIHLDMDAIYQFGGIYIESGAAISEPTISPGSRVLLLGDSWTEGIAAGASFTGFGDRLGGYLGSRDVVASGLGGTGYGTANVGLSRPPYTTRVTKDVVDAAPDLVIVSGSINDRALYESGGGPGDLLAAAEDVFDDIAAGLPDVPLVVVLPWHPGGDPDATALGMRDVIRAAALPYARLVIDPIGGPIPSGNPSDHLNTGWITGTGKVGDPAGDGNADWYIDSDGAHPTQAGHDYLALRIAQAIAAGAPEIVG